MFANCYFFSFLTPFGQMQRFGDVCAIISQFLILSLYPCHSRKLTRFDTTLFSDWSVIGALHLSVAAPNALWGFSRHDPIFSYFNLVRGKLTNNTRISHCFYHSPSKFIAKLMLTHTRSITNHLRPLAGSCGSWQSRTLMVCVCVCVWGRQAMWEVSPLLWHSLL